MEVMLQIFVGVKQAEIPRLVKAASFPLASPNAGRRGGWPLDTPKKNWFGSG
jgi:hypothetical protein